MALAHNYLPSGVFLPFEKLPNLFCNCYLPVSTFKRSLFLGDCLDLFVIPALDFFLFVGVSGFTFEDLGVSIFRDDFNLFGIDGLLFSYICIKVMSISLNLILIKIIINLKLNISN